MANILINGIGRIGKSILRIILADSKHKVVAINEINTNKKNIAYSINYDSTYGRLNDQFIVVDDCIENGSNTIKLFHKKDLGDLNLIELQVDYIIDASGSKIDVQKAQSLNVKKVFVTHPNKKTDINLILGVNEQEYLSKNRLISTSSCNATALLPVLKTVDENYKIVQGDITTVHPFLNHQKVLDNGCVSNSDRNVECNFEFGRSSTQNIIPSQTTTIEACSYVDQKFNSHKISSSSLRVPTVTVGVINVVLFCEKTVNKDELIEKLILIEKEQLHKVIKNNFDPLVSGDFSQCEYTSIIDHRFTQVIGDNMVKLTLWYDNEWGYASKVVDIVDYVNEKENDENNSK